MPKDSLRNLLEMFPFFFDKSNTSNFYKSQVVTNNRFKDLYNDAFKVYESFRLDKRLLVWKEQVSPYVYKIHFRCGYPNLKTVNIFKNDSLIHVKDFLVEDEHSSFDYVYSYDTRNEFSFIPFPLDEGVGVSPEEQILLDKCLFWRINVDDSHFDVNLNVCLSHLKSVTLYKNGTSIYTDSYEDTSDDTLVEYSYRNTITNTTIDAETGNTAIIDDVFYLEVETYNYSGTLTKYLPGVEPSYITSSRFVIDVETYDEHHLRKGFPENDTILGDEFDHDTSLDRMGKINNIPRKNYINIDTLSEFYRSEPPFNDRGTEDDYHYMQRMLEYNLRLHTTPAPVLEIWKLYGVEATMLNRERLLLKLFDVYKHPHHIEKRIDEHGREYEALLVDEWTPEPWEHKDKFFDDKNRLGAYFFASVNNVRPIIKQPVNFTFKVLNSLAEDISNNHTVDIYLNETLIEEDYEGNQWKCPSDLLDNSDPNLFMFIGKDEYNSTVGTVEITVNVRGCDDADFYVSASGSDSNDGSSTHPFRTIQHALNSVNGLYNLIAVIGEVSMTGPAPVQEDCTIIGCNNAELVNTSSSRFFHVAQGKTLTVGDLTFSIEDQEFSAEIESEIFENENITNESETVILADMNYGILIDDFTADTFIKNLTLNQSTGVLSWVECPKSDFTKLSDFTGVVLDLRLSDDDLVYTSFNPSVNSLDISASEKAMLLNSPYLFLEDRENLVDAVTDIDLDDPYLVVSEYSDDIIYDAAEHGLDEFEYQHIKLTQNSASSSGGNFVVNVTVSGTHLLDGQSIVFKSDSGETITKEYDSSNATFNLTFTRKPLQIITDLKRCISSGVVYIGSDSVLNVDW